MLRIAVIGIGHQGKNHLRFLRVLTGLQVELLVDREIDRAKEAGTEMKIPFAAHYRDHLDQFDAAIVAVPTTDHFQIASELIRNGKHVLIEKPVAATVEEAERLSELAAARGVIVQVGFPERFNPAVLKTLPEITSPLFVETHRLGMFSPRSLDVDVVMDLMIHDLDLLFLFLKQEPSEIEAVGIPILSRQIDIANARIKFPGKCVVNVTASRVSAKRMRKMRIFQPYSYLSLDFSEQAFSRISLEPNLCNAGFPEIRNQDFKPQEQERPLQKELEAFRDAIQKGDPRGTTVQDAIPSLRMALAIKSKFEPL